MIVPPRLAAGWLLGCAAAALFSGMADQAFGQMRMGRSSARQSQIVSPSPESVEWEVKSGPAAPSYGGDHVLGHSAAGRRRYGGLRTMTGIVQESPEEAPLPPELIEEGEIIPEGAMLVEGEPGDVVFDHFPGAAAPCHDGACGPGACGDCGQLECCCCLRIPCLRLPRNFAVSGGVHGFKGPINRGADSSFGFNEAFNWGGPLGLLSHGGTLGMQLGVRGAHSNFSGATNLTFDDRNQLFVTGGLFRRVDCGLQFGAVFDWLHEDWDVDLDLAQVRGEISWVFLTQGEVGFRYTGPVTDDSSDAPPAVVGIDWDPTETYALFFRQKVIPWNGEFQGYVGFSDRSEALLGASGLLPLGDRLALSAEFAYLVPEVGAANVPVPGSVEESWNVGVGLIFYPDPCFLSPTNYFRPLFDVANNGTFMYDRDD